MNEQDFDKLMEKYQRGQLHGEEEKMVDKWFESLEYTDENSRLEESSKQKLKEEIFARMKKGNGVGISSGYKLLYRIAASLLLLACLTFLIWQYAFQYVNTDSDNLTTTSSINNKVILPDGTIVWLKGNSRLEYPALFSGTFRKVSLQGEALFEVKKDPEHPFIVQCGDFTTTVLGTSFNIKTADKNIEVVVLTGKVSLASLTDKEGIVLLPNQKAVYNGQHTQSSKTEISTEEKTAAIQGTEYNMQFEDTRMKEIIDRIENKFNVTVVPSDHRLHNCMITADFTDQSLEKTIDMISQALGCEYEIKDGKVKLIGEGCE